MAWQVPLVPHHTRQKVPSSQLSFSTWQGWSRAMHAAPVAGTSARRHIAAAASMVVTILELGVTVTALKGAAVA